MDKASLELEARQLVDYAAKLQVRRGVFEAVGGQCGGGVCVRNWQLLHVHG